MNDLCDIETHTWSQEVLEPCRRRPQAGSICFGRHTSLLLSFSVLSQLPTSIIYSLGEPTKRVYSLVLTRPSPAIDRSNFRRKDVLWLRVWGSSVMVGKDGRETLEVAHTTVRKQRRMVALGSLSPFYSVWDLSPWKRGCSHI